jgi:PAS domain S-box-containing protein
MESGKLTGWDRDIKSGRDSLFGDLPSMFGISSEVYDGRVDDFHRYLHPEDRRRVVEAIDYAMETHKPYAAEFRLRRPDGTVSWLAAKGRFYYSRDGVPERMLGMATDITDRKLVEEALRESEERYRLAIQAGRMYAFDWDVTSDVILRSEEATRLPGLVGEPINLTKQQLLARIHPGDRATFSSSIAELTPERPDTQISFRLLRPDGSVVWLERTGHAFFDEHGKMVRMIGMVADITERRRSEEPLRRSESYLSQAERLAHSGSWAWDVRTRETFWSQEMFRILDYDPKKTRPSLSDFLARVHPEDRLQAEQRVREEALGLDVVSDYRIVLPDGAIRHLQAIGHPIKNESGEVVEVVGTTVDITERKLAEEALSRVGGRLIEAHEEERTRIARELHDDVGQRLVLLAWQLGSSKGDLRKQVEDLANDVQALSHQLHSPKLDYLGLAPAAAGFCKELTDRQHVEIEFHSENIPKELPKEISICLFRVLQEALQNAIKHSGSRQFQVSLRSGASEIELTVRDSGIGFETAEAIKGPGLGLTSMQERLKLVNGQLSIDSKPQRGTTIQARVPFRLGMKSARAVG